MPRTRGREAGVTLIELLVVMVIMAIVSGMIIATWFALNNASAFSSTSDQQQAFARDAVSRMAAEIRDAQAPQNSSYNAFTSATPTEVDFYTTYNASGAAEPTTTPTLVRFRYATTSSNIYREVADGHGGWTSYLLVSNVVNKAHGKDLFTYWAYNSSGQLEPSSNTTNQVLASDVILVLLPSAIVNVTITALVDLNPGHSPTYVTVQTTVQPRNLLPL